jgi:hypothetical protein
MKKHGRGAREMLAAFASVGARRFDLSLTDIKGDKTGFLPSCPLDRLSASLAILLRDAATQQHNVIVRPRAQDTTPVQFDDLDDARPNGGASGGGKRPSAP